MKSELRNGKRSNNSDHTQEKKNSNKKKKKKNNQAINTNPLFVAEKQRILVSKRSET